MPSLNFTIPADKVTDVVDSLRAKFGVPAATQAELIALLEAELKANLRMTYIEYMRKKLYDVTF